MAAVRMLLLLFRIARFARAVGPDPGGGWRVLPLLLLANTASAQTSAVLEEVVSGGSTASTLVSTSGPVTAVSQDLYLAAVASKAFTPVIAVHGLGLAWIPVTAQCAGRNNTGVSIWIARGVPSASEPVTAEFDSEPKTAVITVVRYSGADSIDPIGASVSANSNGVAGACLGGVDSATYSVDLTTTADGAVVFGAVAIRQREHTPGAQYVEIDEVREGVLGPTSGLASEHRTVATAGLVAVDGSMSDMVDWALIGLEILPGAAAGSCGDAVCSGTETCASCAADCGACDPCVDLDGDSYGAFGSPACSLPGADCNDGDAAIFPGATETLCDAIDQNCNSLVDDDVDADLDGVSLCSGDCNDAEPSIFPGATETPCDSVDQNCNGLADDDADADLDGVSLCSGDCNDHEPAAFPGNTEICSDEVDNDCNLLVDCQENLCSERPVCLAIPVPALPTPWARLALAAALLAALTVVSGRRALGRRAPPDRP